MRTFVASAAQSQLHSLYAANRMTKRAKAKAKKLAVPQQSEAQPADTEGTMGYFKVKRRLS
jgi:hypothetical protein